MLLHTIWMNSVALAKKCSPRLFEINLSHKFLRDMQYVFYVHMFLSDNNNMLADKATIRRIGQRREIGWANHLRHQTRILVTHRHDPQAPHTARPDDQSVLCPWSRVRFLASLPTVLEISSNPVAGQRQPPIPLMLWVEYVMCCSEKAVTFCRELDIQHELRLSPT